MLDRLDGTLRERARHVVTEQARVHRVVDLLRGGRPAEIGPELTASHASLRDDFEVSVPALDAVVETALEHGALGARLVGGGFGGSALVLTPATAADDIAGAVDAPGRRRRPPRARGARGPPGRRRPAGALSGAAVRGRSQADAPPRGAG